MLKDVIEHSLIKEKLKLFLNNRKIPRILIFNGPRSVGKKFTALNFINEHFGEKININNHPDIKIYSPETSVFKLELIQDIQKNIMLTPFNLDKKFFILTDIDKMNKESANASLKMFEDVPEYVYFILTCENIDLVLKTIVSRSFILNFYPISNIKKYFNNLTEIEEQLANGCIGRIEYLKINNIEKKYRESLNFFSNISSLNLADVLDFFTGLKGIDYQIIADLLVLCVKKEKDFRKKSIFLKEILDFKPKLHLNLNKDLHLKLCLINMKSKIGALS